MDEFDQLMRQPRLCRVCAKPCQGVRCGMCRSLEGRIRRFVGEAGEQGITEQQLGKLVYIDDTMRRLERDGQMHETPQGWALGIHPEQIALWQAWNARKLKEKTTCLKCRQ